MADANGTRLNWAGWVLTALVVLFLLADAVSNFLMPPVLVQEMRATGWPLWTGRVIGGLALAAALTHAWPRTAVLGAVLVTGFLGGAISSHLRMGDMGFPPQLICLAVGIAAWGGVWLRDPRLRALLPLS